MAKSKTGSNLIRLPVSLTIASVEMLYEQFGQAVSQSRLELDMSDVEVVDTTGLQLLVAAQQRLAVNGGSIEWHGKSEALKDAAERGGLSQQIGL